MYAYVVRRLFLIPLTLIGIIGVNFLFVQLAPGGPIEQIIARMEGVNTDATARISGSGNAETAAPKPQATTQQSTTTSKYRGAQGLDPEFIAELEKQMGFDKPPLTRFWLMVKSYAQFDLGQSYFRDVDVTDLILEKLPVSASLGIWSTLIIYLISVPLGVRKAVKDGSKFDVASSWAIIIGHAIPGFLFAILLIIVFAGGRYLDWFPLRGLTSDNWQDLSWLGRIADYAWHMVLPVGAMVIGGFASLTMLTKNAFLEEINKQYVLTARAKGVDERGVLYGHIFRNAMLVVIAGFPATLVGMLFTGSVLIEVIFSLDGIGLLGFEAAMNRDYPVMFGTLFAFSLLGLALSLISDLTYHFVDPRIDFSARSV